jgi:plastocyanin domain-containing protein
MNRILLVLVLAACACNKAPTENKPTATSRQEGGAQVVELTVTETGFQPAEVKVKAGTPVKLLITRKTDKTCATEITMAEHQINTPLPLDKQVEVAFTPTQTGRLKYGCAMGQMVSGVLLVE